MKLNKDGPTISDSAKINNGKFGKFTFIDERVRVTDSQMDDYSYLLHDSEIIYTTIGKFCAIAPNVRINPGNHPFWRPAMANFTYRSSDYGFGDNDQDFFDTRKSQRVSIGNDVWVGQGALIMPGVVVGDGAVIGGNAVVTKDVPPYHIVGGVPAKLIRKRFDDPIIASLLRISWWDWSYDEIKERIKDLRLNEITDFCVKYDELF